MNLRRWSARTLGVVLSGLSSLALAQGEPPTPPLASEVVPPESAPAQEAPPAAATSIARALAQEGCSTSNVVTRDGRYYAVCGEGGVWVFVVNDKGELEVLARHRVRGKVSALFVQGDEVWVASRHETAEPLRETAFEVATALPLATTVAVPIQPESGDPEGTVVSVKDQEIVVSLGSVAGLRLGDRVEIYTTKAETLDDTLASAATRDETVLVGTVTALSASRARVAAGFGEFAVPGMKARATKQSRSVNRVAPERVGHQLIVEGSVRPFLPVDNLSFAAQGDASATYLPAMDAYAKVELRPLGLLIGKDYNPSYAGAYASGGYDQTYFGLGLGIGVLYARRATQGGYDDASYYDEDVIRTEAESQFSALQHVRLGARDGLRFSLSTAVLLEQDRWTFGWGDGDLQVPVGTRSWFCLRGSGSSSFFISEFGFRRMVRGNGGPGSLFLRPSAGVAGIGVLNAWGGTEFSVGPLVGLHVETRLAR